MKEKHKIEQRTIIFEKGKNYILFNPDLIFEGLTKSQIELLEKIKVTQKLEPFQLKDLIECEGILKNNPLNFTI
jgi:hypothetical protein